jgi:hypothetical protein
MDKIKTSQLTKLECTANDCCSTIVHLREMMDKQKLGAYTPFTTQEESILNCFNINISDCFCFRPIDEYTIIWISLKDCPNIEIFEEEYSYNFDNYEKFNNV